MKPGQIVVCVNGLFNHPSIPACFSHLPIQGRQYTIREIRPANADGGILLEEIKNEPILFKAYGGYLEPAFHPSRFLPQKAIDRIVCANKEKLVESN